MNTGTAIYQGDTVYFSDFIVFNGKAEYLIAYNGQQGVSCWVLASELSKIVYHVARLKA